MKSNKIPAIVMGFGRDKLTETILQTAKKYFPEIDILHIITRHHEEDSSLENFILKTDNPLDELLKKRSEIHKREGVYGTDDVIVITTYSPTELNTLGPKIGTWFDMVDTWGFESPRTELFAEYVQSMQCARRVDHLAICGVSAKIIREKLQMIGRILREDMDPIPSCDIQKTAWQVLTFTQDLKKIKGRLGPGAISMEDIPLSLLYR